VTPEELAEQLRTRDIPWHAATSQRTLVRIEARLNAPRRSPAPRLAFALAVMLAVLGLWLVPRYWLAQHSSVPPTLRDARATVTLPDTSLALLDRDAHIDVPEHSDAALSIVQDHGSVEYRVTPGLKRTFTVRARNLEIRVVGTAFTVALEPNATVIAVDHGRVLVSDGADTVALTAHDRRAYPIAAGPAIANSAPESAPAAPLASGVPDAAVPTHSGASLSGSAEPPGQSLLQEADRARRAGKFPQAIAALQKFVQASPTDPRVPSAAFTLGRLYRQTGNLGAAAGAFRLSYQRDASGALAEDARAQEIEALSAASAWDSARAAAKKYLELYPHGRYQSRIAPLLE
jgi:transmembrane sensor